MAVNGWINGEKVCQTGPYNFGTFSITLFQKELVAG